VRELEPKHEAQKRGARSPDWGDAVAMCFAPWLRTGPEAFIENYFARAEQRQYQQVPPMKFALNRQTGTIELAPRAKAAPPTQPAPGTPRRKTVFESYLETGKINENECTAFSSARCAETVANRLLSSTIESTTESTRGTRNALPSGP
jgi:hypothetical protein